MVTTEYKIAYNEVLEILKYVAKEDVDKIPKNMLDMFKSNASSENNFNYNPTKTFKNRNITQYSQQGQQTAIVEYKEKNFLQKLFDKIKHTFKIK